MMNKSIMLAVVMVCGGTLALSARADVGGALPDNSESAAKVPVAESVPGSIHDVPELVVEFQTDHADIPSTFKKNLNVFGNYLKHNPGTRAEIAGYADHVGSGPANGKLAQKRAEAVKNYLVTIAGIEASRITAAGYGQITTKSGNSTGSAKQANRAAIQTIYPAKS